MLHLLVYWILAFYERHTYPVSNSIIAHLGIPVWDPRIAAGANPDTSQAG